MKLPCLKIVKQCANILSVLYSLLNYYQSSVCPPWPAFGCVPCLLLRRNGVITRLGRRIISASLSLASFSSPPSGSIPGRPAAHQIDTHKYHYCQNTPACVLRCCPEFPNEQMQSVSARSNRALYPSNGCACLNRRSRYLQVTRWQQSVLNLVLLYMFSEIIRFRQTSASGERIPYNGFFLRSALRWMIN